MASKSICNTIFFSRWSKHHISCFVDLQRRQNFVTDRTCRRGVDNEETKNVLMFSRKHEWASISESEGNVKHATIGISNYAQEALGDIVFAQLPDVDTCLSLGDECGALESVKAASEIYSPLSGTVIEKNENVEATPSLVNTAALSDGWLFKLKLQSKQQEDELNNLMTESQYESFLKSQEDDQD